MKLIVSTSASKFPEGLLQRVKTRAGSSWPKLEKWIKREIKTPSIGGYWTSRDHSRDAERKARAEKPLGGRKIGPVHRKIGNVELRGTGVVDTAWRSHITPHYVQLCEQVASVFKELSGRVLKFERITTAGKAFYIECSTDKGDQLGFYRTGNDQPQIYFYINGKKLYATNSLRNEQKAAVRNQLKALK